MPNRVIHFEIQADQIERAKDFYEKAFGWKFDHAMSKEKGDPMEYWTIDTGEGPGIGGGMYPRDSADQKFNTYDCTLAVQDIDKAIADVKANGGTITRDKSELTAIGWFAGCMDPEGNRFGLMQPTEWQAK